MKYQLLSFVDRLVKLFFSAHNIRLFWLSMCKYRDKFARAPCFSGLYCNPQNLISFLFASLMFNVRRVYEVKK